MSKEEIIEAAANHPANASLSQEEIEKAVGKYWSRVDYLYSDTAEAEVDHMIAEGYFDIN